MLSGNDTNWCTSLFKKLSGTQCFEKPRTSQTSFTVCHFAEKVTYMCQGFMEKNLDTVSDLQVETLKRSSVSISLFFSFVSIKLLICLLFLLFIFFLCKATLVVIK